MSVLPSKDRLEPTAQDRERSGEVDDSVVRLYEQIKSLARRYMARERPDHTLQPTALANEAYIRLNGMEGFEWQGRTHFLAVAATQMRRVLVEHARSVGARKRGGDRRRISLHDHTALTPERSIELLALDEALRRLHRSSPRQARIAEMRLFTGLDVVEVAAVLGVTDRTIKRDWRIARAWLACELSAGSRRAARRAGANVDGTA